MKSLLLYYHTIRYLKPIQVFYQLWYRIKWHFIKTRGKQESNVIIHPIVWDFPFAINVHEYLGLNTFNFLNQKKTFLEHIDWNFMGHGKLWNYQLQYMNCLLDEGITQSSRLELLKSVSLQIISGQLKSEPYPVSLRLINSLIFCSKHSVRDEKIRKAIGIQLSFIKNNIEYHLLGNHVLINYISLSFTSLILQDELSFKSYFHKLVSQLELQIFEDGGHYERTPMYHAQILHLLLGLIYLMNKKSVAKNEIEVLKLVCGRMMGWYSSISLNGVVLPLFNDTTVSMTPAYEYLQKLSEILFIDSVKLPLRSSGFRILKNNKVSVIINCGAISPSYQPGHTHSDMLHFVLCFEDKYIIVDTGVSTYTAGIDRLREKSTRMHNTVSYANMDQSQIWSSFRLGKRAHIRILEEDDSHITAEVKWHNGMVHKRSFILSKDNLNIEDTVSHVPESNVKPRACFHFDHRINLNPLSSTNQYKIEVQGLEFSFIGSCDIVTEDYQQAENFNKLNQSVKLSVYFADNLKTLISWNH